MTTVDIHPDAVRDTLNRGAGHLADVRDAVVAASHGSGDPRVKSALAQIGAASGKKADDAAGSAKAGSDGAGKVDAHNRAAANRIASTGAASPSGAAGSGASTARVTAGPSMSAAQLSGASPLAGMASPMPPAGMLQGGFVPQLASQAVPMMTQLASPVADPGGYAAGSGGVYPQGSITMSRSQLAALVAGSGAAGGGSSASAAGSAWNGSTKPDPIDVKQVAYQKTVGVMTPQQYSAVVDQAMDHTGIKDPAARAQFKEVVMFMGENESSLNAGAVNMSDSNAVGATMSDGAPAQSSRGVGQTIPGTFASNHAAGTSNNIYDPVANTAAQINYMKARYNIGADGSGLAAFKAARSAGGYTGY